MFTKLETVLIEVEAVINSRPLAFIYSDPHEGTLLTPSHFLLGKRVMSLPEGDIETEVCARGAGAKEFEKRWKYRKRLVDGFWTRWKKEYLLQLRSAHFVSQPKTDHPVCEGDVVLIEEEKLPRQQWKMARFQTVIPGRDGKSRAVILRLTTGATLRRPLQRIYPLEVV